MAEKKPVGTILKDEKPELIDDVRNLRHERPGEWNKILKEKQGVKLVDADVKQSARSRHLKNPEDGPTKQDVRNIRHEADGKWVAYTEELRKTRGYDLPPIKMVPEEETEKEKEEAQASNKPKKTTKKTGKKRGRKPKPVTKK